MHTKSSHTDWREARRYRVYDLAQRGWSQTAIAEALGITQSGVSHILARARAGGVTALRAQPPPGRVPRLTAAQDAELVILLAHGAEAHGFQGALWTSRRVTALIARHFGITFSDRQVRRILHRLGWSRQRPVRRATQRDEDAIQRWRRKRWPTLKKLPPHGPPDRVRR